MAYPQPGDVMTVNEVWELAKSLDPEKILENNPAAAERIVLHSASGLRSVLSPMCATSGGIVSQEVLKVCSGKFTPS